MPLDDLQQDFISAVLELGTVRAAREHLGISRGKLARWYQDPEFRAALASARALMAEELEDEAWARVTKGIASDHLLAFLLQGRRREIYSPRGVAPPPVIVYHGLRGGDDVQTDSPKSLPAGREEADES